MLKRLLIAVLVLSLVIAFTGTAFSEISPESDAQRAGNRYDNPFVTDGFRDARPAQANTRTVTNEFKLPEGHVIPGPPLETFCEDLDYSAATAVFRRLYAPGYSDEDFFNVRYSTEENFSCTVGVFWILPYNPVMEGTPDLMCFLWDDDGLGNPGALLDSILIPYATLNLGYAWYGVDFLASANAPVGGWVFENGEEYHLGVSVRDNSGVGTDLVAILLDDAASATGGRTSFWDTFGGAPGTWGTYLGIFGIDRTMIQSNERCCGELPFTDCYTQSYWDGFYRLFQNPHPAADIPAHAMRFDVGGPETLVSVDIVIYNAGDTSDAGVDLYGADDILFTVVDDNAGLPGTNVLYSELVLAGTYGPSSWVTIYPNMVVDESFHVVVEVQAVSGVSYQILGADFGDNGQGHSSTKYNGTWYFTGQIYSAGDCNFLIDANLCTDQFTDCDVESYFGNNWFGFSFGNDGYAFRKAAGVRMFANGQNCQVNDVQVVFEDYFADFAYDFAYDTKISVYTDVAGEPGVELASVLITPGNYVPWPAYTVADFSALDVYVTGDYWAVMEYLVPAGDSSRIWINSDDGTFDNGGHSYALFNPYSGDSTWVSMQVRYGDDLGWDMTSALCCIPYDELPRVCAPGSDAGWGTFQGNQQRTGASDLELGDAWCNLNLNWAYEGPNGISFTGPVIYGDKAVCSFTDRYVVFDIINGTPLYTLDNTTGDGFLVGTAISCAPTVANIGGVDMLFIGGGSSLGVGAIDFNSATGTVLWQNTLFSGAGIFGNTAYTVFTILNDGASDVLYHTTGNGFVVALDALTGALYAGWGATNPVALTGHPFVSGSTDGTNLYFATQDAANQGDIYSLDAATGAINWTLSGSGGLQANLEAGYNGYPEGFRGGVAYDYRNGGVLYASSWANDGIVNTAPIDGFFYSIVAADGSHYVPPTATNRADFSTPIVDENHVYVPTFGQWNTPQDPTGGNLIAFHKATGVQSWGAITPDDARYYGSGLLTCEPDVLGMAANADLIFAFNFNGFLECYNSVTGEQIFSRRVEHDGGSGEIGLTGALATTATDGVHMLYCDFYGGIYDLTLGDDRPRLELQRYNINFPIDFGPDPALQVDIGPIIVNTGCADLTFAATSVDESSITVTNYPGGFAAGYVTEDYMERADAISDYMQREAFLSKFRMAQTGVITSPDASFTREFDREVTSSNYAAGIPAWFISLDQPTPATIIAAGDTSNLLITVNQPIISRGPQTVYIAWDSNDPDYFLNSTFTDGAGKLPEIKLTIVGGCLIDTTTLHFGMGSANSQSVTNTARLGTGDWTPHGFDIAGDAGSYYQGAYLFGVSKYEIATNSQDWLSGGSEFDNEDAVWFGLQADPNWCDNSCKPDLSTSVAVGAITADGGLTYDPITADMVCKTYVDSVTSSGNTPDELVVGSFGWSDWADLTFDDTLTMGLMVHTRTIGVSELPELANLTLEIMEFNERNGVDSITDWYFGQITDYDVGGDNGLMDQSISTSWAYNPGGTTAWGSIKIPFGCGTVGAGQDFDYDPLRSIKVLDGASALFWQAGANGTQGGAYWDSAYTWLSLPDGAVGVPQSQDADFEMTTSYANHDFEPGGSFTLGIANFALTGMADNTSSDEMVDLANMTNKWAGFGRGDVNNDGGINLADIIYLAASVNGGPGAIPFAHLSDVNADGTIDAGDINYLVDYYFNCGPCPMGDWMF